MTLLSETFVSTWFNIIAGTTIQITLFLLFVLALSIVFRRQSAAFLHALWIIGLSKLLIPLHIPVPDFLRENAHIAGATKLIYAFPSIESITTGMQDTSVKTILFLIWFVVVVSLLLLWLAQGIRFRTMVKRQTMPHVFTNTLTRELNVNVYVLSRIKGPFTTGLIRQKVYIPEVAKELSGQEINALILHEYAHMKRKDTLLILFQNIVQIIYFFHPLVWLANRQISREREKACDDYVIQHNHGDALRYGKLLLKAAQLFAFEGKVPLPVNSFGRSKKAVVQRFEYILNRRVNVKAKVNIVQKAFLTALLAAGIMMSLKGTEKMILNAATELDMPRPEKRLEQSNHMEVRGKVDDARRMEQTGNTAAASEVEFKAYDAPPKPVGGFAQIQKRLAYPEIARKAGIEGQVVVHARIDEAGKVSDTRIIKSLGNNGCDEAALSAIRETKWHPAMSNDRAVAVWIAIPVMFRLD